jgi:hypothetical protein
MTTQTQIDLNKMNKRELQRYAEERKIGTPAWRHKADKEALIERIDAYVSGDDSDEIPEVVYLHMVPKPETGRWWPMANFQIQIEAPIHSRAADGSPYIERGNERKLARFESGIFKTRSRNMRDALESRDFFVKPGTRPNDQSRCYRRLDGDDLKLLARIQEKGTSGRYLYAEFMEKLEAKRVYEA